MTKKQGQFIIKKGKGHRGEKSGSSSKEQSSTEGPKKRKRPQLFRKQNKKPKTDSTEKSGDVLNNLTVEYANPLDSSHECTEEIPQKQRNPACTPDKHKSPRFFTKKYPWELLTPKRRARKHGKRLFDFWDHVPQQLLGNCGFTTATSAGETLLSTVAVENEMYIEDQECSYSHDVEFHSSEMDTTAASEAPLTVTSSTICSSVAEGIAPLESIPLSPESCIPDAINACAESVHSGPDQSNLGNGVTSPNQVLPLVKSCRLKELSKLPLQIPLNLYRPRVLVLYKRDTRKNTGLLVLAVIKNSSIYAQPDLKFKSMYD